MLNLIRDNISFKSKQSLIELSMAMEYMQLPKEDMIITPLSVETLNNTKNIVLGVDSYCFVYASVHKKYIEGFISRYFLSRYRICLSFTGL